jgi:hypothetical protein
MLLPLILLGALIVVVMTANAMKKKGTMSESTYQTLVSVASIIVTVAAIAMLYLRLRGGE